MDKIFVEDWRDTEWPDVDAEVETEEVEEVEEPEEESEEANKDFELAIVKIVRENADKEDAEIAELIAEFITGLEDKAEDDEWDIEVEAEEGEPAPAIED